eukprot:7735704-Karenia_brevis.AAC.1
MATVSKASPLYSWTHCTDWLAHTLQDCMLRLIRYIQTDLMIMNFTSSRPQSCQKCGLFINPRSAL